MDYSSNINADVPIKTIDDDELNRADFSIRVAESILNYDNEECLVLGLMGEWGSGKTSIRNMVFEHIESNVEHILIKFNPWYFSNQDSLLFHFFDELTESFNKKNSLNDIRTRVSKLMNKLVSAITLNAGIGGNCISLNLKDLSYKENYETVNSIKEDLIKLFADLDYKIIISIDDIDRLTNDEIKQIFLLVKSLANFPNVIYILSFEDFVVKEALSSESYSGDSYLEKIIQIPIFVPEVTQTKMNNLIIKRFKEIFADSPDIIELYFDSGLKSGILWKIFPFINTIRDLNRYMNLLNFYKGLFIDELNMGNFLILLLLQVFEPEIYKELKNRKYDLINFHGIEQLKIDEQKDVVSKLFNDFYVLSQTKLKNELFSVLLYLFPIFTKVNKPNQYFNRENINQWVGNKRISTKKYFDKYFTLSLEENEVSELFISNLLKMKDADSISKRFIELDSRGQIKDALNKFIPRIEEIPQKNCSAFIMSMLDIGEIIDLTDSNTISNSFYICSVLEGLIEKLNDRNALYELLKSKLMKTEKLFTVITFVYEIGYDYEFYVNENPKNENEICISKDQYLELKDIACNKIKELNETGRLVKDNNLATYLTYWHNWGHKNDVINVFDSNFENNDDFIEFLYHFRRNCISGGVHRREIAFDKISEYYDLEKVVNKIKEIKEIKHDDKKLREIVKYLGV